MFPIQRATGICWLKVKLDDQPASEHSMRPGEILGFKARYKLSIFLGNAGAVELEYNGRNLGKPGEDGEARQIGFPLEKASNNEESQK